MSSPQLLLGHSWPMTFPSEGLDQIRSASIHNVTMCHNSHHSVGSLQNLRHSTTHWTHQFAHEPPSTLTETIVNQVNTRTQKTHKTQANDKWMCRIVEHF